MAIVQYPAMEEKTKVLCDNLKSLTSLTSQRKAGLFFSMNSGERIGRRIAQIRQLRGLSQAKLGERLNRVQPVIYQWEHGKTRLFVDDLLLLADALDVPISAFFDGEDWRDALKHETHDQSQYAPIDWELQVAASYMSPKMRRNLVTFLLSIAGKNHEQET